MTKQQRYKIESCMDELTLAVQHLSNAGKWLYEAHNMADLNLNYECQLILQCMSNITATEISLDHALK